MGAELTIVIPAKNEVAMLPQVAGVVVPAGL